jgi:hypothetical protein
LDDIARLGAFFEIEAVVLGDPDGTKEKLHGFAATMAGLGDPVEQTYDSLVRAAG